MKMLNRKTLDVAIVISVAVAVFKTTKGLANIVWQNGYQSDSYVLTTILINTAWLLSAIAYIAALLIGVLIANNLNSKRSPIIVFLGVIAILTLPLKFYVSSQLCSNIESQAQTPQTVLPLSNIETQMVSCPTRLQCFTSTNGILADKLVFDGDDILEVTLSVSQYDETNLLHLRLIQSASDRLLKATSPSPGLTRWFVFTTNHVFLTNSIIKEPINNGCIYVPMESKPAASKLANGIHDYLYQ